MKKNFVLVLVLALALLTLPAYARNQAVQLEAVEYMGFGYIEVEFEDDCDWRNDAQFILTDGLGMEQAFEIFGRDDEECYLRLTETDLLPRLSDGAACTLTVTTSTGSQSIAFELITGQEYKLTRSGEVRVSQNDDRCDWCGSYNHDEDFCPDHFNPDRFNFK